MSDASDLLDGLRRRGWTVAVAESLTGGQVVSALVDVPGASAVVRGGVVAYATEIKRDVLGVDAALLAAEGAVHPEVARQMAAGVAVLLRADVGIATTGVAGPEPQDGTDVGTVCIAVTTPSGEAVETFRFSGDRAGIRSAATARALAEAVLAL